MVQVTGKEDVWELTKTRKAIPADPTKMLKVIAAGFSRTATVSFSMAMQILLEGPVCHCGTTCLLREEAFIKKWISICNADPVTDSAIIKDTLRTLSAGYVSIADTPSYLFSGELAELYPDAIVICTIRDPVRWHESMKEVMQTVYLMVFLNILFLPLPTLRHFGAWVKAIEKRSKYLYNENRWDKYDISQDDPGKKHLEYHAAYLKRVIQPSRLYFFNVKDGWAPLCKILNVPIPDIPFPHGNDKIAIQETLFGYMKEALRRWLVIFAALGVVLTFLIRTWTSS
ncbi:NAD dependent epimerase/dehydratase [Stipitochalara longipes BDJ]|nr:NAD dependent epimerase/dehydratase [Stipitochalara longipes BDJ]